jgi:magnesium transporter
MRDRSQLDLLIEQIRGGELQAATASLGDLHAADVAEILDHLDADEASAVFRLLDDHRAAEVLEDMSEPARHDLLEKLSTKRVAAVIHEMVSDDAADVLGELPPERADRTLALLSKEARDEVRPLLQYDEESAGGIMAAEVIAVREEALAAEAIESIRDQANEVGDLHYVFTTDRHGRLVGVLDLKELLLSRPGVPVSAIMDRDVVSVRPDADQERVANLARKYDLMAVPVVDQQGKLVGRITIDDLVDVMTEEASEDISRMAGTDPEELGQHSVLAVSKLRLPWLITGLGGGIAAAVALSHFETSLQNVIALAFFVPVITAMAGNAAMQSSAIMVRGLATGELTTRDAWPSTRRELGVATLNGLVCGTLSAVIAGIWRGTGLGLVVGSAMLTVVLMATVIGSTVPLALKRLGVDPALATGPFVTTTNDILGILVYLVLATQLLRLLG